jgi:transposase InsO family protein
MFVREHRDLGVERIRRVLKVASSTFYGWLAEPAPSDHDDWDRALLSQIADIRAGGDGKAAAYGSPRVHQALRRNGIRVGRKRVERLLRSQGWQGACRRRTFKAPTTVQDPAHTPAPDLVNRQFTADAPNRLWVADVSEIVYQTGKFYLAAVRDAFSNKIVGWSSGEHNDTDLILRALEYAAWHRDYTQQDLIHHSDKGANYTSFEFGKRLRLNGIRASMGSTGDSYDNALMENFWSTLKIEYVFDNTWTTRAQAETALFDYIDGWYNPTRIQKGLGWRSPDEYEAAYWSGRLGTAETSPAPAVAGHSGAPRVDTRAGPGLPASPDRGAAEAHGSRAGTKNPSRSDRQTLEA